MIGPVGHGWATAGPTGLASRNGRRQREAYARALDQRDSVKKRFPWGSMGKRRTLRGHLSKPLNTRV